MSVFILTRVALYIQLGRRFVIYSLGHLSGFQPFASLPCSLVALSPHEVQPDRNDTSQPCRRASLPPYHRIALVTLCSLVTLTICLQTYIAHDTSSRRLHMLS